MVLPGGFPEQQIDSDDKPDGQEVVLAEVQEHQEKHYSGKEPGVRRQQ